MCCVVKKFCLGGGELGFKWEVSSFQWEGDRAGFQPLWVFQATGPGAALVGLACPRLVCFRAVGASVGESKAHKDFHGQ